MPGGYQKTDLSYLSDPDCGHRILGRVNRDCGRTSAPTRISGYPTRPVTGSDGHFLGTTSHFYGTFPWDMYVRTVCALPVDGHALCIPLAGFAGRGGERQCHPTGRDPCFWVHLFLYIPIFLLVAKGLALCPWFCGRDFGRFCNIGAYGPSFDADHKDLFPCFMGLSGQTEPIKSF